MKDKILVETGLVAITGIIFVVALIGIVTFAFSPTTEIFNSLLLTVMIVAQLITVIVLIKIYEVLRVKKK